MIVVVGVGVGVVVGGGGGGVVVFIIVIVFFSCFFLLVPSIMFAFFPSSPSAVVTQIIRGH